MRKQSLVEKKRSKDYLKRLKGVANARVMVGIPKSTTAREGNEPTNAEIAYINEHGSIGQGIPPRPFMSVGMKKARPEIKRHFFNAAHLATQGNKQGAMAQLEQAGMAGASAVKLAIVDGDFVPLSPYTIKNRHKQRLTKSKRKGEKDDANFGVNVKPLINTGQLLQSITYVVKKGG